MKFGERFSDIPLELENAIKIDGVEKITTANSFLGVPRDADNPQSHDGVVMADGDLAAGTFGTCGRFTVSPLDG